VRANRIYVSASMDLKRSREGVIRSGCELLSSWPDRRQACAEAWEQAATFRLRLALFEPHKRPRCNVVSLRPKLGGRRRIPWFMSAFIAGKTRGLYLAINPGDVIRFLQPSLPAPMHNVICGLDIASTSARAALIDREGAPLNEVDLPASRDGEDRLLALLPSGSAIVLESTGRYHLRWARRLSAAGHQVYLLNALLAKRLATSTNALRENKSDPIDARHLAHIGRIHGRLLVTYLFQENPARLRLRELCQVRVSQRAQLTQALGLAHHYLFSILPEAEACGLTLAQNQPAVALFLTIDSLARLRALRMSTLQKHLGTRAASFAQLLRQPLSAAALFDAVLPALQAQLRLIASLNQLLRKLLGEIRAAARQSGRQHLITLAQSIPGFGEKNTPTIIACLPDGWETWGDKRTTANKLQAFFGFDPRLRTSGKWQGQVKMTKRGSRLARTALYQVAFCALNVDVDLHASYAAQRALSKSHDVAISHVMRRQLRRLVAVLKNGTPYVPAQSFIVAA
jgi:transposase